MRKRLISIPFTLIFIIFACVMTIPLSRTVRPPAAPEETISTTIVETQALETQAPEIQVTETEVTEPPATEPPVTEPTVTEPQIVEPTYVSKFALEDYLLPLYEHSWGRQFDPELVMIHFTSAVVDHRKDPYNVDNIRDILIDYDISVHYLIERDGTIRCYIPENRVAWHAGLGEFGDDERYTNNMNQYSIGIEIVGIGSRKDMEDYLTRSEYNRLDDSLKGFTKEQYESLRLLVNDLCERYHIPMDRDHVIGHEDYSPDKKDPGELFDWAKIIPDCE